MNKIAIIFIAVVFVLSSFVSRAADEYPTRPIQLICPYGAGGVTDVVARVVADKMTEHLGKPVIVANKPGGGTAIGTGFVAASKPDGYTMLINMTGGFVVTPLSRRTCRTK